MGDFGLKPRQIELLRRAARGDTMPDILRDMGPGYTLAAVQSRYRLLFVKMGARNKAHAVALAYQWGILDPKDTHD